MIYAFLDNPSSNGCILWRYYGESSMTFLCCYFRRLRITVIKYYRADSLIVRPSYMFRFFFLRIGCPGAARSSDRWFVASENMGQYNARQCVILRKLLHQSWPWNLSFSGTRTERRCCVSDLKHKLQVYTTCIPYIHLYFRQTWA
jgi:hypothetical protein